MSRKTTTHDRKAEELSEKYEKLLSEYKGLQAKLQRQEEALAQLSEKYSSREQLIDELYAEQEQLNVLVDHAPIGIVITDEHGNFLFQNREAEATVGGRVTGNAYGPQGGYTLHYPNGTLIPEEDLPMVRAIHRGETIKDYDMVVRWEDGQEIYLKVGAVPVRYGRSNIYGAIAILEDVTERKIIEAERAQVLANSRQQRKFMEKLIEEIPVGIAFFQGPDHRYIVANQMHKRITSGRRTIGNITGQTVAEVWPELAGQVVPVLNLVYKTGETVRAQSVPYPIIRNDKPELAYYNITFSPLTDEMGQAEGILALAIETTAEVLTRKQVEAERDKLQSLLESMSDEVWYCDLERNVALLNDAAIEGLGLDDLDRHTFSLKEKVLDQVEILNLDGTPRPIEETPLFRSLKGETVQGEEIVRNPTSGELMYRQYTSNPIRAADGEIYGAVAVVRNITRQKLAEQAVRESEVRFRQLADAMPQLVWTATPTGKIDYFNSRRMEYRGIVPSGDDSWDWTLVIHPDDLEPTRKAWLQAVENQEMFQVEHRMCMKDGAYRWHLGRGLPAFDANQRVIKWYGTSTDIHVQKQTEESLRLSESRLRSLVEANTDYAFRLEQSNKELENFAYVASHDLQEPLRKITAFSRQVIGSMEDDLDEKIKDHLERILNASQRMQDMIKALLELSRVNTQGRAFSLVDLNEVATTVISDLERLIKRVDGEVTIETLPTIKADPMQMHQLFQNLIGNSLKYHRPDTKPIVRVYMQAPRKKGQKAVTIFVRDNGIGFDEGYLERIFQPFQRLVGHSEFEGSGMGLAICKKIVDRHGGTITARSKPGEGSTFMVTLPM